MRNFVKLRNVISKAKVEKCGERNLPVLSMTMHEGLVLQSERFKKEIASVDKTAYSVVKRNQLVESFPIDEGVLDTQILVEEGIVSPAYKIWDVDNSLVDSRYIALFLRSPHSINYYKAKLRGSTARRRTIPDEDFLNMDIYLPNLDEQKLIVEQYDLLKDVITKKRQQIEELDTLLASTFFNKFGDPEINERNWQTAKFSDCIKLKSGDALSAKNAIPGPYPVYGGNGISGYHKESNMTGEYLIIGRVGVYCGNVHHVKGDFWLTDNAFESIFDKNVFDYIFLENMLRLLDLHKYANQAAQPVISNVVLKDINLIIPPKEDQIAFASQAEAINHKKQTINKSIKEVQSLLDASMERYFA